MTRAHLKYFRVKRNGNELDVLLRLEIDGDAKWDSPIIWDDVEKWDETAEKNINIDISNSKVTLNFNKE